MLQYVYCTYAHMGHGGETTATEGSNKSEHREKMGTKKKLVPQRDTRPVIIPEGTCF